MTQWRAAAMTCWLGLGLGLRVFLMTLVSCLATVVLVPADFGELTFRLLLMLLGLLSGPALIDAIWSANTPEPSEPPI